MDKVCNDIIESSKKTLETLEKYLNDNQKSINIIDIFQLEEFKNSLTKMTNTLMIKKFNLVFMGKSGKGKTTCISSILNIYYTDEDGNLKQVMPSDAGGHTTCCSIEINVLDDATQNFITVIPTNIDATLEILENYCRSKIVNNDTSGNISEEHIAIIETNLDTKDVEHIHTILNSNVGDTLEEENAIKACIDYLKDMLEININDDMEKNILIVADEKNSILKEIGENIYNLNYGLTDNFLIPDKLVINISRTIINIPPFIKKIVDTRGISSNEKISSRDDLKELINDKENLIIYINEYTNLDGFVKEFYNSKLQILGTTADELISFILLINAYNTSSKSKAKGHNTVKDVEDKKIAKFKQDVKPFCFEEEVEKSVKDEISKNFNRLKGCANNVDADIYNFKIYTPLEGMKKDEDSFEIKDIEKRNINIESIYQYINDVYNARCSIIAEYMKHYQELIHQCVNGKLGISDQTVIAQNLNNFEHVLKSEGLNSVQQDYLRGYLDKLLREIYRINAITIATVAKNGGYRKRDNADIWKLTGDFHNDRVETLKKLLQRISILQCNILMEKVSLRLQETKKVNSLREAVQSYYIRNNKYLTDFWYEKIKEEVKNIFFLDTYKLGIWSKTVSVRNDEKITYLSALKKVMDDITQLAEIEGQLSSQVDNYLLTDNKE